MIEVFHEPKRELEFALCDILNDQVDLRFFPNYGNDARETPFGAVICEEATPLVGGVRPRAYLCNVQVIFVSHIDEADSQEHGAYISKIEDALMLIPNQVDDSFNRYLRRDELYGYTLGLETIERNYDQLRTIRDTMATTKIHTDDPDKLAKELREAIYACSEYHGDALNAKSFKDFVLLGSHYTFESKGDHVLCQWNVQPKKDRYILARRHIQISGLYIESLSARSQEQSFGDLFQCRVGITEIC